MTILGVDLSSNQGSFDFQTAWNQGVRTCYIKLGGDNIARYESGSYAGRVDQAKAVGMTVGSYWITGGHDPSAAADFFAAHLENFGAPDYVVLDNEGLDSGNVYSDGEAAAWVNEVLAHIGGDPRRVVHYGNTSLMNSHEWPQLLATGCTFIIANYNGNPFGGNFAPHTIPADRIVGHQYADNGNLGGWSPVDLNAFTDTAFNYQEDSLSAAEVAEIVSAINASAEDVKNAIRREGRGRLFYCPNPPTGLPEFVVIFENRNPGQGNVLYCNSGSGQADHLKTVYGQTFDTVAQAMAVPDRPDIYATRIALALGTDSAFTNQLAPK